MNTHSLFSYDFPKRSIIASATTLKKARNPQSAECKMLLRMMSEHPDFEVAEKTIQKKPGKQTYKGLTFGRLLRCPVTAPSGIHFMRCGGLSEVSSDDVRCRIFSHFNTRIPCAVLHPVDYYVFRMRRLLI